MGKHAESSKKNSLNPNTASHNTSGRTEADGFLEHSPSGGSLDHKRPVFQKIILVWGRRPLESYPEVRAVRHRFSLLLPADAGGYRRSTPQGCALN